MPLAVLTAYDELDGWAFEEDDLHLERMRYDLVMRYVPFLSELIFDAFSSVMLAWMTSIACSATTRPYKTTFAQSFGVIERPFVHRVPTR